MGLFDVNMPLIYGEGSKAFRRLQEAINLETTDTSILLHDDFRSLATCASFFGSYGDVQLVAEDNGQNVVVANQEIRLTSLTCPALVSWSSGIYSLAILNCHFAGYYLSGPALLYRHSDEYPEGNKVSSVNYETIGISPNEMGKCVHKGTGDDESTEHAT